jgi:hypothetical protein
MPHSNMFLPFLRMVPRNEQALGKVIEYLKCELNLFKYSNTCHRLLRNDMKKATQERFFLLLIYLVWWFTCLETLTLKIIVQKMKRKEKTLQPKKSIHILCIYISLDLFSSPREIIIIQYVKLKRMILFIKITVYLGTVIKSI